MKKWFTLTRRLAKPETKATGRKPEVKKIGGAIVYSCPSCGEHFRKFLPYTEIRITEPGDPRFCPYCGQKIDWDGEEYD